MSDYLASDSPRISIVMPSFNQAAYLEEAINSILDQDYCNTELIVMDGGSTDGSVDILQRYANAIAYWESGMDDGQSDALNKSLRHITGDIVGWLNSDDTYAPGTLHEVARVFGSDDVAIAMSSRFGLMDATGNVYEFRDNSYADHQTLVRFWTTGGMTINQPCVFFRSRLLDGMNTVFDTNLNYAMDYDLWLRLTQRNEIKVVEGHWANYRFHDTSKSGTGFDKFFPEWYAVSRRYWGKPGSPRWWGNRLNHLYSHYPRRMVAGLARRLRGRAGD